MNPPDLPKPPEPESEKPSAQWSLMPYLSMVGAVTLISVAYRLVVFGHLEQTALMFIGLPALLAVLLGFSPPPKSATGMIMKGISLFLLLLGILFIEGFICILMAAPLCYAVGFIIGIFTDKARARKEMAQRYRVVILPSLLLMSLEGITETLSFPREELVTIVQHVDLPLDATRQRLAAGPHFDRSELPAFLKLGFPQPQSIKGNGLEKGDVWTVHFAGGEGSPGDLVVEVMESSPDHLRLICSEDGSHIAHWLDWQQADWRLEADGSGTRVTLELRYRRLLDPAWYFKPIERYGVRKAGEYFMARTFTEP